MTRNEAKELLFTHLKNQNLRNHCVAVAAIMEALAEKFDENTDEWFITGLLHDIDLDFTGENPAEHGLKAMELLKDSDLSEEQLYAIRSHADQEEIKSLLDKALWAADPLSGLIIAGALMHPSKKVSTLPAKSLKKRFKDKRFAAGASRDQIKSCENFDIPIVDFIELSREAMAKYETEIGF